MSAAAPSPPTAPARPGAAATLADAFDILERDAIVAFTRMADELHGLAIRITVDGEVFNVVSNSRPQVLAAQPPSSACPSGVDAVLETSRQAILDLVDGEIAFLDAVLARRLRLTAPIEIMPRLSRAQRMFTEGAVRARRIRPLLDRFRAAT